VKFWENVSRILEQRGLSLRALAREIDLTPGAVAKYAHGTVPGLDVAVRIAQFLNVSLDALVWSDGAASARPLCPAPDEHTVLKELVTELGFEDTLVLTRLATQAVAWKVADVLAARFPRFISEEELGGLVDAPPETLRASLLALRKRKVICEDPKGGGRSYQLVNPVARFSEKGIGDISGNATRAVRMLFGEVIPRLEEGDAHAHLTTVAASVPEAVATEMARELHELIVRRSEEYTRAEGGTPIHLVFAVAVGTKPE